MLHISRDKDPGIMSEHPIQKQIAARGTVYLDGFALGLASPLASLLGPWEVCDGNDEEGVAGSKNVSYGCSKV